MAASLHPSAGHDLPSFITAPGETDVLMVVMGIILVLAVLGFGILFLRLHTLPERIAHRSHKLQFEIVAVLGLIALFTHMHIFWIAGLLLAMIDLPDFGTSLNRIAESTEKNCRHASGRGCNSPPVRDDHRGTRACSGARRRLRDACGAQAGRRPGRAADKVRDSSTQAAGADSCLSFCSARW
jgi:hypothetical protein